MARYWSLGRRVLSSAPLRLPLDNERADADASIHLERIDSLLELTPPPEILTVPSPNAEVADLRFHRDDAQAIVDLRRGEDWLRLRFLPSEGAIHYDHAPTIDAETFATIIEGMALGLYHRLSGHALLHGAAVRWADRGVAICGPSGAGKSTLTAMLAAHGAAPWSEDILRFDPTTGDAFGDARERRLDPAAIAVLRAKNPTPPAHPAGDNRPIFEGSEKRVVGRVGETAMVPLCAHRLDHILVLGGRTAARTPVLQPLGAVAAIAALMKAQYPSWLTSPADQQAALNAFAELLPRVRVSLLHMPDGLEASFEASAELLASLAGDAG